MYRRPSSIRLIAALAIVSIVALMVPALVSAAPVAVAVTATSTASTQALVPVAEAHAAAARTAAAEAEAAAALAEQKRVAAALAEQKRVAALAEQKRAAAAYTAARATAKKTPAAKAPSGDELARARSILASLKARYPRYLSGVTVSIGSARGYQAISYYTSGRIVISPTHTASLERILGHEIWHIIDWRDNNHIDWGERIPPANASSFR